MTTLPEFRTLKPEVHFSILEFANHFSFNGSVPLHHVIPQAILWTREGVLSTPDHWPAGWLGLAPVIQPSPRVSAKLEDSYLNTFSLKLQSQLVHNCHLSPTYTRNWKEINAMRNSTGWTDQCLKTFKTKNGGEHIRYKLKVVILF